MTVCTHVFPRNNAQDFLSDIRTEGVLLHNTQDFVQTKPPVKLILQTDRAMLYLSILTISLLRAHTPPPDDFMNDDIDSYLIAMDTSIVPGPSATDPPTPPLADSTFSKQPAAASHRTRSYSDEEEEDEIANSEGPPNKKVFNFSHEQIK